MSSSDVSTQKLPSKQNDDHYDVVELFRIMRSTTDDNSGSENDNSVSILKTWIEQADINSIDESQEHRPSILITAVCYKPELIEYIIQKGCNINYQDSNGMTALHWMCCCYHFEYFDSFRHNTIDGGITFDVKDQYGLRNAIEKHRSDAPMTLAATFFKECGANINIQDNDGNTPLHRALLTSIPYKFFDKFLCIHIIDFLLKDCNAQYNIHNDENKTALDIAIELNLTGTIETIAALELPIRNQMYNFIYTYWFGQGDDKIGNDHTKRKRENVDDMGEKGDK
jgi:ankyrin repeat protein